MTVSYTHLDVYKRQAQARFDEAAELHEQQAARLQKAVQRKEEAVRKYWDSRIKQAGQERCV